MCCYKLVTIKFHIFGLENKIQQYIDRVKQFISLVLNSYNIDAKKSFFEA